MRHTVITAATAIAIPTADRQRDGSVGRDERRDRDRRVNHPLRAAELVEQLLVCLGSRSGPGWCVRSGGERTVVGRGHRVLSDSGGG
jgi:hypothetical protein